MRRRLLGFSLAFVLLLAAAAHVAFWYAPRERAAAPAEGAAAALFRDGAWPLRIWLPYPHQNLAALRRAAPPAAAATLRLLGLKPPRLPRFGPFSVPPATAIAVGTDRKGEHFLVVAEVYPLIGQLARAAGKLAGNPWLAGGEVDDDGRRLRVGWSPGGIWWATTEGGPGSLSPAPGAAPALPPSLAWLHSDRDLGPLPAGDYRLAGPVRTPALVFRDAAGVETRVLDLGGDGSQIEIRLPR